MLHRVVLVRTDVSEKRIASIIRVTIGELETLAATSNRNTLQRNTCMVMEAVRSKKRGFLQEPRGVTSQKTAFFRVTAQNLSPQVLQRFPSLQFDE
jgi:hypothetical protein